MTARSGAATISPVLRYTHAKAAIAQLTEAFGFTEDAVYEGEDGTVLHAELSQGNGVIMIGSKTDEGVLGEALKGAGPGLVYVAVPNVDAHFERARDAGADILTEPTDKSYGGRDYLARDLEGTVWSFGTYVPGEHG